MVGNVVAFRVHAPCSGALLLDIFANAVTPQEYLTGEPMKFKSVCKFKIVCDELQTVMVPLPDCASGEWGKIFVIRFRISGSCRQNFKITVVFRVIQGGYIRAAGAS